MNKERLRIAATEIIKVNTKRNISLCGVVVTTHELYTLHK